MLEGIQRFPVLEVSVGCNGFSRFWCFFGLPMILMFFGFEGLLNVIEGDDKGVLVGDFQVLEASNDLDCQDA